MNGISKAAEKIWRCGEVLVTNRQVKNLRGLAIYATLLVLAIGTAQTPQDPQGSATSTPEATLIAATAVPLYANGKQVGNVTLPAGTPVGMLVTEGETTLIGTSFGQINLPTAALSPTGKPYKGKINEVSAMAGMEEREDSPRNLRALGHAPFKGIPSGAEIPTAKNTTIESTILTLANAERAKVGAKPLQWDENLARAARYHAQDMAAERYYTHATFDRVNGRLKQICETFTRIDKFTKSGAGENIACGEPTPQEVMRVWMNSPGHRKNILDPEFKTLGAGVCNGYWVQDFGR